MLRPFAPPAGFGIRSCVACLLCPEAWLVPGSAVEPLLRSLASQKVSLLLKWCAQNVRRCHRTMRQIPADPSNLLGGPGVTLWNAAGATGLGLALVSPTTEWPAGSSNKLASSHVLHVCSVLKLGLSQARPWSLCCDHSRVKRFRCF